MASVTMGFIGTGEIQARTAKAILTDQMNAADGNLRFIIPLTEPEFTDGMEVVAAFALQQEIPLEIITNDSTDRLKGVKEYIDAAAKEHTASAPYKKILDVLEQKEGLLVVLLDTEHDETIETVEAAADARITIHDLTSGFDKIVFKEPGSGSEPEPPAREDDAPRPATRYSEDDLKAIDDVEALKKILTEVGGEALPPRSRKGTYVAAILERQGADGSTGEVIRPDIESQVERGLESRQSAEASLDEVVTTQNPLGPSLVGSCSGCGGPIFATGTKPTVTWNCAPFCGLTNEDAFKVHFGKD